jgi:uncharacterized protein (DUF1499 family)
MVTGPGLAYLRLVRAMVGFGLFVLGGVTALVLAVVAILQAARGRGLGAGGMVAIGAAVVFMVIASRGSQVPAINDFTTDLADPPTFRHAATLPPNQGRDLAYPQPFAGVQRACCPDLAPLRLPVPAAEAFGRVRDAAGRMPAWTVTHVDPTAGTVEAVVTTRLFGFEDDVVVRVRAEGAAGSRVDVRSKSRDGRGDIGANAARIRAFLAALASPGGQGAP